MKFKKVAEKEVQEFSEIESNLKNEKNIYTLELIGVDFDQNDQKMNTLAISPPLGGVPDLNEWAKYVFNKEGPISSKNVDDKFNCYNTCWNIVEYSEPFSHLEGMIDE